MKADRGEGLVFGRPIEWEGKVNKVVEMLEAGAVPEKECELFCHEKGHVSAEFYGMDLISKRLPEQRECIPVSGRHVDDDVFEGGQVPVAYKPKEDGVEFANPNSLQRGNPHAATTERAQP